MRRQAASILAWSLVLGLHVSCGGQALDQALTQQNENDQIAGPAYKPWEQPSSPPMTLRSGPGAVLPGTTRCYICTECPKISSNTPTRYNPQTADPTRRNKCVVYSAKYIDIARAVVIRGSVAERGTCLEIRRAHQQQNNVNIEYCDECVGDLCNSSFVNRSMPGLIILIVPLLVKRLLD